MVALKAAAAVAGLGVVAAAIGIAPVGAKPKATSWDHQGLTGIRGVDVSRWQHVGPGRLDFDALQAQGVRFVIIKSGDSYGSAHNEAGYYYRKDKAAAKRAGMLVGAYYYAVPTSKASRVIADARAQGRKAAARVGGTLPKGHLPLALDLETDGTATGSRSGSTCEEQPWPPAAGRRRAGSCSKPWPASTPKVALATWSPMSTATAR